MLMNRPAFGVAICRNASSEQLSHDGLMAGATGQVSEGDTTGADTPQQ